MDRRDFLKSASLVSAALTLGKSNGLFAGTQPADGWRTFDVTTRAEILKPAGVTRIWIPAALITETPFQRTVANTFNAEGGTVKLISNDRQAMGIIVAEFPADAKPVLLVKSRIATKNYVVDLAAPGNASQAKPADLEYFLQPTKLVPTDGIVQSPATEITSGAKTDVDKARAIYEWIVENTFRNPKTRGCGLGDIRFMLETKDLGGKCADLNALYVGLARASGLPARDVYGIRVAQSELGYKSLGPSTEIVTKAQHCRAEVFLTGFGWVPVDPADVRKVVLEEKPNLITLADPVVPPVRAKLFGAWEMNWLAYNEAADVKLPGSTGAPVAFLMYPQAENGGK